MAEKELMRIGKAARLIGISPSTLRRLADKGQVRYFLVGPFRQRRFAREDVVALLREGQAPPVEGDQRTPPPGRTRQRRKGPGRGNK